MTDKPVSFLDLGAMHDEIRPELERVWTDALTSGRFAGGPDLDAFEAEFAQFCDAEFAIGVANGTDALELILRTLGVGPGDEVLVPGNTFIATAEAVGLVGATPVFIDVDPTTALITGEHVRAALTPRTAAVMAVHLYGQTVDMDALLAVTDPAGVHVIEDAAQAHGATWNGRRAGSMGIAAGFSFYPGKNLGALGDGGAVTTNDADLARRLRSMANHGRSDRDRYEHDRLGRNSRLDAVQAAALRVKLGELERWNKLRRNVAAAYVEGLPENIVPYREAAEAISSYHLFVVRSMTHTRDEVAAVLDKHEIGWGIHYPIPCHIQRPFATEGSPVLPVSEEHASQIISLPMHPHVSNSEIQRVCAALRELGS